MAHAKNVISIVGGEAFLGPKRIATKRPTAILIPPILGIALV
jgi:hypothetical protein